MIRVAERQANDRSPVECDSQDGYSAVPLIRTASLMTLSEILQTLRGDGSTFHLTQPVFGDLDPTKYRHYILDDNGLWEDVGGGAFDASSNRWSTGLRRLGAHLVMP